VLEVIKECKPQKSQSKILVLEIACSGYVNNREESRANKCNKSSSQKTVLEQLLDKPMVKLRVFQMSTMDEWASGRILELIYANLSSKYIRLPIGGTLDRSFISCPPQQLLGIVNDY